MVQGQCAKGETRLEVLGTGSGAGAGRQGPGAIRHSARMMGGSSDAAAAGDGVVQGGLPERLAGSRQQGAAFAMLCTLGQGRLQVRRCMRRRRAGGKLHRPRLRRERRGVRVGEGAGAVVGRVHYGMRRGRQTAGGPCQVRGAVALQMRYQLRLATRQQLLRGLLLLLPLQRLVMLLLRRLCPAGLGAISRDGVGLPPHAVQLMWLGRVLGLPLLRGQAGGAAGGLLLLIAAHLVMLDLLALLEEDHRTFFG